MTNVSEVAQLDPSYPPIPKKSRLERLLSGISAFLGENDLHGALRLSDCATRLAPDDGQCALVHARLLNALGFPREALRRLEQRRDPEALIERALASHLLRSDGEAAELCESLLARFALDSTMRLRELASALCRSEGDPRRAGWVGVNPSLQLEGEARRGSPLRVLLGDLRLSPWVEDEDQGDFYSFVVDVPAGRSGRILVSAGEGRFLGSDLNWPPDFGLAGWVIAQEHGIAGKIRMDWAPDLPIELSLRSADRGDERRTIFPSPLDFCDPSSGTSFEIGLGTGPSPLEVAAILPDGSCSPLIGSPVVCGLRQSVACEERPAGTIAKRGREERPSPITDIVVPVYAGCDETLCCLQSILATTTPSEAEVVVVNDASPDPRLCAALEGMASEGRITLVINASNLGFPGAANAGMNLHPDRDVVLMNSDAEPFDNWLERLRSAAYRSAEIGTATPLGEAASIVSYPDNDAHRHTSAEAREIDRIAREANAGIIIEIPVGVGFCLYVKRACLAEAGGFDEAAFGKGYGEENDLCLRASRLGWRHVAAPNLFVRHRGATSFGSRKTALMERNSRVLNALHPGYDAMVAKFEAGDPLRAARRAIDMRRLARSAKDPVLMVTCNLRGGVQRHIDRRKAELAAQGRAVLVLQPATHDLPAREARLLTADGDIQNLIFALPQEIGILRELLGQLQLARVELHHFAGLPGAVLELVGELGVPYDVFVHDYAWICPRLSLAGSSGAYCGEPAVAACESCIRQHGSFLDEGLTVAALRARSARILDGAGKVVAPSEDVRARLARYFPSRPIEVSGWETPAAIASRPGSALVRLAAADSVRVAVIGAIGLHKGFRVLMECVQDARERKLDIEFIVIGFTCDDEALEAAGRVFITGPYSDDEAASLLERERCGVAFFPSIFPETWCYALTHALAEGLPVLAFDLGAIPERLRGYGSAQALPLHSPASTINDALLRLARNSALTNSPEVAVMDSQSADSALSAQDELETDALQTSVQFLPLPEGTYTITVKGGAAETASPGRLALPAVQVGVAPTKSQGKIEFLSRGGTTDRWLARKRDMIVARISGGEASLMLTSVTLPSSASLGIDIRRLDPDLLFVDPEAEAGVEAAAEPIPAQIVAHIHRIGDVPFTDGLAGCIGDGLWIEAFAIGPFGQLTSDQIEYCGVTADGYQTPWLDNQTLCGSRGRSIPMVGCAIRLKPGVADRYDCEYTGQFVSGKVLGPFKNGDLCCSDIPSDPLWGLELFAVERARPGGETSLS